MSTKNSVTLQANLISYSKYPNMNWLSIDCQRMLKIVLAHLSQMFHMGWLIMNVNCYILFIFLCSVLIVDYDDTLFLFPL